MNLYRIDNLSNEYKSYDWRDDSAWRSMNDIFSADRRLKKTWKTPNVVAMSGTKKLATPSFGNMNSIEGWLVSAEGAELLSQFKDCCEVLPVHGPEKATDFSRPFFLLRFVSRWPRPFISDRRFSNSSQ